MNYGNKKLSMSYEKNKFSMNYENKNFQWFMEIKKLQKKIQFLPTKNLHINKWIEISCGFNHLYFWFTIKRLFYDRLIFYNNLQGLFECPVGPHADRRLHYGRDWIKNLLIHYAISIWYDLMYWSMIWNDFCANN